MIDGVSENGGDEERPTRLRLTDLAHRLLAIIALGALLAGAPAWAISGHEPVIAGGAHHTCALSSAGAVRCWGENAHGELGNGTSINSRTPVAVSGLSSGFVAIAAGNGYACALSSAGAVQCWGDNQFGQLGNGTSHTIERSPVAVSRLSGKVVAIAAGAFHTCALSSAGAVQCWGENSHGELGNGTSLNSSTPVAVAGVSSGFVAIAAGRGHACALGNTGAIQCWGDNQFGQLGNGTNDNSRTPVAVARLSGKVVAIAAGDFYTCVLSSAGAVQCWGENSHGQLGNGMHNNSSTPVAVSGLSGGFVAIAAGTGHTCALGTTGAMQCWGDNEFGQLGNGTNNSSRTPVAVARLSAAVIAIAAGAFHTCALSSPDAAQCWGENTYGELGNGTSLNSSTPVAVSGLTAYGGRGAAGPTDGPLSLWATGEPL
jgi:alpha-tubulin suppressor-like RCC1 family protein